MKNIQLAEKVTGSNREDKVILPGRPSPIGGYAGSEVSSYAGSDSKVQTDYHYSTYTTKVMIHD